MATQIKAIKPGVYWAASRNRDSGKWDRLVVVAGPQPLAHVVGQIDIGDNVETNSRVRPFPDLNDIILGPQVSAPPDRLPAGPKCRRKSQAR